MTPQLQSKLPAVGTTIFTVMSRLAADCDAINLSQGFPSFEPPEALLDRVGYHLSHGANQYAPMPGVQALREAIATKTARLQSRDVDPETEVTVCTGATEGMFAAIQALVRTGDEVVVFDPAYDAYAPAIHLAGGIVRHLPLITVESGDFAIDWQALEDTLNQRTRLVVVNFPHNPSGAILTLEDLDELAQLINKTDAFVLADEVYEHIVFDGRTHYSILRHDDLWERCLVVSSFGKTFHATGWKVGYCLAPPNLTTEFRKVRQFTTFAVNTPVQHALADYLAAEPGFCESLAGFYQAKRDLFAKLLEDTRLRFKPSRSTFFQTVDYAEISDEPDVEIAQQWTRELGVASIPYSVFYEHAPDARRLRFCFAKDDATLVEACERLRQL